MRPPSVWSVEGLHAEDFRVTTGFTGPNGGRQDMKCLFAAVTTQSSCGLARKAYALEMTWAFSYSVLVVLFLGATSLPVIKEVKVSLAS